MARTNRGFNKKRQAFQAIEQCKTHFPVLQSDSLKPAELFEAIAIGDVDRITFLLAQGVSVDEKVLSSTTALPYATGRGRVKVVALLIKYGAILEVKDDDGLTAQLFAARTGCVRVVTKLLRSGADADATDNEGATVLSWTVKYEHQEVATELVRHVLQTNTAYLAATVEQRYSR